MQEHPKALSALRPRSGEAFPGGLLPHEGRALLLTAILSRSADRAEAVAFIGPDHPYLTPSGVESTVALELFAQAAALVSGLADEPARQGRLAAVHELDLDREFVPVGTELTITVSREGDHGLLTRFSGALTAGGKSIARGVIVVALTERPNTEGVAV